MARGQFHLDSATYLAAVRAEVPAYDEFQDAVAEAAGCVAVRRVLELGIGTGETAHRVLQRQPSARLVAIDASTEMVRLASQAFPEADVRVGRIQDPLPEGPYDLVVSALAVHHLPSEEKVDLFSRVAECLTEGGRFVLGDVVVPERPEDATTPIEPGVDLPDRLVDQLEWLAAAGFAPRVAWKKADLAVIAAAPGRKASETPSLPKR